MVPLRTFPILASTLLLLAAVSSLWISLAGAAPPPPTQPFAEIAGTYYRGDGLGSNQSLDVTAHGSFRFHWSGCLGTHARSRGRVLRHGALVFLGTIGPQGLDITESGFLPVRWGERHYLVPAGDVMSFVSEVNLGSEPRTAAQGMHYLRQDDWKAPVSGFPELPDKYRPYLLDEPVAGVLYKAPRYGDDDLTFGVAAGRDTELLAPGMALVADSVDDEGHKSFCELKVVAVSAGTVTAERNWEAETDCWSLRPGDRVSTSLASLSAPPFRYPGRRVG